MKSGGNNFNYFPENKQTKLANFVQFICTLCFRLEDWGGCAAYAPPCLATATMHELLSWLLTP